MNIRPGTKEDMPAVLDLIRELAAFEREPHAVVVTVDELVKDGFGQDPLFYTLVAETGDGIIGMALFYYRYSTFCSTSYTFLIPSASFTDAPPNLNTFI